MSFEIKNVLRLCNMFFFHEGCVISSRFGLAGPGSRMKKIILIFLIPSLYTAVFVEQPLALPGSAKYIFNIYILPINDRIVGI